MALVTMLGVAAAVWGLVMAVAPVLQIRRMWLRRSAEDVSVGFFALLMPGFGLWIAYGTARSDWVLVIPNVAALLVGGSTIAIATLLRRARKGGTCRRNHPAGWDRPSRLITAWVAPAAGGPPSCTWAVSRVVSRCRS